MTDAIVRDAREHLIAARNEMKEEDDGRWGPIFKDRIKKILKLDNASEVLHYSQRYLPFNHREIRSGSRKIHLYHDLLCHEFPHREDYVNNFSDNPYSLPKTLWRAEGRVVSNILYWHLRSVFMCMEHCKSERICEIGGGSGSVARLFLTAANVRRYVIIDLPESLFFAEICLKAEGFDVAYYDGKTPPDNRVVLVPVSRINGYADVINLVVSIGSLQEMSQKWVDTYMCMLDGSGLEYFYSLNYAGQPLGTIGESRNWWSCHPGPSWTASIITADIPLVKIMTHHRNFAEHLYRRVPCNRKAGDWRNYQNRALTRQTLLECLDCLRYDGGKFTEAAEFVKAVVGNAPEERIKYLPKELIALAIISGQNEIAERLSKHAGGLTA